MMADCGLHSSGPQSLDRSFLLWFDLAILGHLARCPLYVFQVRFIDPHRSDCTENMLNPAYVAAPR